MKTESSNHLFETIRPSIINNRMLREPQIEAWLAAKHHFSKSNQPALIQMPVGCGKSGLISMLPFGIAQRRVLIVAPNLTIRDALFASVDCGNNDCFFRKRKVAAMRVNGPFAAIIDGRNANLADCHESHFVVANIQQIAQAGNRWLAELPSDFFDMVIFDEGHHNAAKSWQRLLEHFPEAKFVSLTATPFRSDGKEVVGKSIYHYSLLRSMQRGYIKMLEASHVAPSELAFTFGDTQETATLEEILTLREEVWFSRGVALAEACNQSIVDESLRALERIRTSGTKQQIIAAACSVEHAEAITGLYQLRGYNAATIHSRQAKATQRNVLQRLKRGDLDVIIQVQMLGEGFDHPPLSVAAVFRPFRTLSPYVQFAGRIMRVLTQNNPLAPENRGVIVTHVGLNTDRHWDQFKSLDHQDQSLLSGLLCGTPYNKDKSEPSTQSDDQHNDPSSRFFVPEMLVEWEMLLEEAGEATPFAEAVNEAEVAESEATAPPLEVLPIGKPARIVRAIAGPQQRRREARSSLSNGVNSAVGKTLTAANLYGNGRQVARMFPRFRHLDNWSALRFWIYVELGKVTGRGRVKSEQWSLADIEKALDKLPDLTEEISTAILAKSGGVRGSGRVPCRPFGES